MPRKPVKPRKIRENLTGRQIEHLLRGWCLAVCSGYGHSDIHFPFRDEAHRRELWLANRDYLMGLQGVKKIAGVFGGGLDIGELPAAYHDHEGKEPCQDDL